MKSKRIKTPKERLEEFNKILDYLNTLNCPVVVEGKRDTLALRIIGYNGNIVELNDGRSVLSTVELLSQKLGISGNFVIMTDWDRTGGRLAKQLKEYGESSDLQPDLNIRRTLASLCSKDISCIEELPAMVRTLQNQATI
jgi:5S rRNA maturation endonuclease (ribonuclease M5)